MKTSLLLCRALLALVGVVASTRAQSYLVTSTGPGSVYSNSTVETVYPIGYYNLGYEFTTAGTAMSVSALGFYDSGGNGFNYAHDVGIWTTSGTLLGSVTLAAGAHTLTNGFAFVNLSSPVTLAANTNYVLGAVWAAVAMTPQDALHFNQNGNSPALNGATLVGDRWGNFGNNPTLGLAFPGSTDFSTANYSAVSGFVIQPLAGGAGASFIGPNLEFTAVPEPSTYAAIAGSAMLGLAVWRRRRAAAALAARAAV
jgi:hypothetical protein